MHPWNFGRLLWQWSRRNLGPVDGGSRGLADLLRWGEERLLERNACWPKCSSGEVWQSGVGYWAWFLPLTEEVAENGDCVELGVAGSGGSIVDGVGDGTKAVDNSVSWCDSRDGEVVVMEVDCVGDAEGLGVGINDAMAAVMLKRDANVESIGASEVSGVTGG